MAQWKRVGLRILMGVKLSKGCKFESCCGRSFTFLSIFPFFHRFLNFFYSFSAFFHYVFSRFWYKYFFPDENTMQNRSFIFICYHVKWISNPFRFFQNCAVYSAFIPFSFVVFVLHTFSVSKNKLLSIFVDSESMCSTIENSISAGVFVTVQSVATILNATVQL